MPNPFAEKKRRELENKLKTVDFNSKSFGDWKNTLEKLVNVLATHIKKEEEKSKSRVYLQQVCTTAVVLWNYLKNTKEDQYDVSHIRDLSNSFVKSLNNAATASFDWKTISAILEDQKIREEFLRIKKQFEKECSITGLQIFRELIDVTDIRVVVRACLISF